MLLLIALIYIDNIENFPEILSFLWKMIILSFPIVYFLIKLYGHVQIFIFALLLCALKLIFNSEFGDGFTMNASESLKLIVIPILAIFIGTYPRQFSHSKLKKQLHSHKYNLIWFILILLSSNVLFLLNIFPQLGMIKDLHDFGLPMYPLNGIFNHISISSKVFSLVGIIVIFSRKFIVENYNKIIYNYLFIISGISVLFAFTRTGWIIFLFALIYYGITCSQFRPLIFSLVIFFFSFIIIPDLGEGIKNKLINTPKTAGNIEEINKITSGRLGLYEASYKIFKDLTIIEKLIGIGKKETINKMYKMLRNTAVPHNRFIEILLYGGIINLLLFLVAIIYLACFSFNSYIDVETQLVRVIFCVFLISLFPSHGLGLYGNALFGYILGLKILKNKIINDESINIASSH
ncbi:uncharacterized protein METZ01_LOCUS170566, partial [marine metagenome]